MSRARLWIFAPFALAVLFAALLCASCGSTSTADIVPPTTGVVIRAESLSAGLGCGTGPAQVFKYAVVVFGLDAADVNKPVAAQRHDEYVASNVYDCFTDGTFVELPAISGSSIYAMEVYAYNRAAYGAVGNGGVDAITARLQNSRVALFADGGGAREVTDILAQLTLIRASNPTYSTTCSAEQLGLVQSVAACQPLRLGAAAVGDLKPGPASVELPLGEFLRGPAGGKVTCNVDYVTVRASYRVGKVLTPATDKRCSALDGTTQSIIVSPAEVLASYVFDVTLLRGDGTVLGATTCSADTSPGVVSPALCKPLP